MRRLCYVLDLHDDPQLIAEYERWHQPTEVWPEVRNGHKQGWSASIDRKSMSTGNPSP